MATGTSGTPRVGQHVDADGGPGSVQLGTGRRGVQGRLAVSRTQRSGCGVAAADGNQRLASNKEEAVEIESSRSLQNVSWCSSENKLCVSASDSKHQAASRRGLGAGGWLGPEQPEVGVLTGHVGVPQSRQGRHLVSKTPLCLSKDLSRSVLTEFKNKPQKVTAYCLQLSCDTLKND